MRPFWGMVSEIRDRGVVAEHCPYCDRLTCCLLRSVSQGNYVFFIKIAELSREGSCMCTECHKNFSGKPYWQYADVAPIRDAQRMKLEDLLAKTNPVLADRIHFKDQIRDLGGDDRFAIAYEHVEGMRPGTLRSDLLHKLLDWMHLSEAQRDELVQRIRSLAQASGFARQMAIGFPVPAGCLTYVVTALVVGLVILCVPAIHGWLWGTLIQVSALISVAVVNHSLFTQTIHQWTRTVLIPESQEADVSLDSFATVIDDVPGSKLGLTDEFWPMKEQLKTICRILIENGKLQSSPPQAAR